MRASILVLGLVGGLALTVAPRGAAAQAPPHWTCPANYVGDGYCDCGCGNYDPDCDATSAPLYNNCTNGFNCAAATDPEGRYSCISTRKPGVPSGWTYNSTWWDDDAGCDCGGGEYDPDCADPNETVLWCQSGQVCTPSGTCAAPTSTTQSSTSSLMHFGGMCSVKFEEGHSSKLNNTVYKVRLGNSPYTEIDASINMKTTANIQATYSQVYNLLYNNCRGGNVCRIYGYSAGASAVQYTIAQHPTLFTGLVWVQFSGAADGGSPLSNWGRLAELAACPMASTLGVTTQRNLFNHNVIGNMGKTVYRSGGKGHDWYAPWGWSSAILWAGTSQIGGEDDGAVGVSSAAGCTTDSSSNTMSCAKFTGNVCNVTGCPLPKLDHYEMKMKGMIEDGW